MSQYPFFQDLLFWLTATADGLLLFSIIFAMVYALCLAAASIPPLKGKFRPSSWGLPLAFPASAAVLFTPASEIVIRAVGSGLERLYLRCGEIMQPLIAGLWFLGFVIGLAVLVMQGRAVSRGFTRFKAAPADPAFEEAEQAAGLKKVRLKEVPGGRSPFSWGLPGRRWIGTPPCFRETFSPEERYAVYLHELTHIKNKDSWKYLLAGFLKALFWFNPFIRLALSRYKNHLEIVCDQAVLKKYGLAPLAYARLMTRALGRGAGFAPGFSQGYGDAARRFGYLFGDAALIPVKKDRLTAAACLLLAVLGLAWLNPAVSGFQEDAMLGGAREVTGPDGRPALLKIRFQWRGVLGTYTVTDLERPGAI